MLGWKKVAAGDRVWDVNQCSKLGERTITDGIKTEGKACKGYCNDFDKQCNAINWNPRTDKCIAWECGTPTPIPTALLPGFEAYTREEEGIKLDPIVKGYFIFIIVQTALYIFHHCCSDYRIDRF